MGKKESLVVGLDIGTTKICTVIGEISEGQVNIIGLGTFPSKGLRKGVVKFFMNFNREVIHRRVEEMNQFGIKVRWAGREAGLWKSVVDELKKAGYFRASPEFWGDPQILQNTKVGGNRGLIHHITGALTAGQIAKQIGVISDKETQEMQAAIIEHSTGYWYFRDSVDKAVGKKGAWQAVFPEPASEISKIAHDADLISQFVPESVVPEGSKWRGLAAGRTGFANGTHAERSNKIKRIEGRRIGFMEGFYQNTSCHFPTNSQGCEAISWFVSCQGLWKILIQYCICLGVAEVACRGEMFFCCRVVPGLHVQHPKVQMSRSVFWVQLQGLQKNTL